MSDRIFERFAFAVADGIEDDRDYGPGGFFPVKLGDILSPEGSAPGSLGYRISAKLGYGSYSTVWLARDFVAGRTVAIKIVQASESATSREAAILKRLRAPISDSPAVIQLLDSFTLTSANGIHQALVTEPVILLEHLRNFPGLQINMRSLVRQALEGLAFIHERGIAHGDLYPSNIGVAVPNLDAFSENDIWYMDGAPEIVPLVPSDPAHDPASFPPYLTQTMDLRRFLVSKVPGFAAREPRVRILDLGCGYFAEESPSPRCHTPLCYAAPEVAFPILAHSNRDAPWDRRADIWAMGCTIHQIAVGRLLFGNFGSPVLDDMAAICGGAPADWAAYLASLSNKSQVPLKAHTPEAADAFWAKTTERLQSKGQTLEDARGLVKLLRRMVVIDPMERPSASALLQDPYFDLTTSDHSPHPIEYARESPVGSTIVVG
ncbi:kinase-like domain-containing protein [Mycena rebaudengoi]|nr:kinase-like domain-containing protein [Mycena rebaudengoi]